jgi:sec-independent protein translocase protein TatA
MGPTWFKLLLVVFLIVVLFGRGRISDIMGDFGKGIKDFKKTLGDDDKDAQPAVDREASSRLEAPARRDDIHAG